MDEQKFLAERFEANRAHLRAVAYRMLGSRAEVDDAVQEAWLRLSRSDAGEIDNLGGWLTTVVARVCLDMLRARKSRREEPMDAHVPEPVSPENVEREALLADSIGAALLVVLETLSPAERLAFVLHDMFAVPFEQIAPIVDRSPEATRQLASRARRRVQGREPADESDLPRQRKVVDAFLKASQGGNFEALLAVLDPDVVFRADRVAAQMGGQAELRGAAAVAETFKGRAQAARPGGGRRRDGAGGRVRRPVAHRAAADDRRRPDHRDRGGRRPAAAAWVRPGAAQYLRIAEPGCSWGVLGPAGEPAMNVQQKPEKFAEKARRSRAAAAAPGPSAGRRKQDASAAGVQAEISRRRQAQGQGRDHHRRRQRHRPRGRGRDGARGRDDRDPLSGGARRREGDQAAGRGGGKPRRSCSPATSATRCSAGNRSSAINEEFGRIDILVNNAAEQHEVDDPARAQGRAARAHVPHQRVQLLPHDARLPAVHAGGREHHQHDLDHRLSGPQDADRLCRPPRARSSR